MKTLMERLNIFTSSSQLPETNWQDGVITSWEVGRHLTQLIFLDTNVLILLTPSDMVWRPATRWCQSHMMMTRTWRCHSGSKLSYAERIDTRQVKGFLAFWTFDDEWGNVQEHLKNHVTLWLIPKDQALCRICHSTFVHLSLILHAKSVWSRGNHQKPPEKSGQICYN